MIRNTDQRSHDYSNIMDVYRPGHADYTPLMKKYGFRDYRGGGRSSEERLLEEWQWSNSSQTARKVLGSQSRHIPVQ